MVDYVGLFWFFICLNINGEGFTLVPQLKRE
jgi:hypothetical protein